MRLFVLTITFFVVATAWAQNTGKSITPLVFCSFRVTDVNHPRSYTFTTTKIFLDTPISYPNEKPIGAMTFYQFDPNFKVRIEKYFSNAESTANQKVLHTFPTDGSWGGTNAITTGDDLKVTTLVKLLNGISMATEVNCKF
ncbi:MAG: hypothetical protein KDD50_16575 [Bdellovibrionales bacterium]|nr:hypothetical protein [Bdellovibrionales bacterium]